MVDLIVVHRTRTGPIVVLCTLYDWGLRVLPPTNLVCGMVILLQPTVCASLGASLDISTNSLISATICSVTLPDKIWFTSHHSLSFTTPHSLSILFVTLFQCLIATSRYTADKFCSLFWVTRTRIFHLRVTLIKDKLLTLQHFYSPSTP